MTAITDNEAMIGEMSRLFPYRDEETGEECKLLVFGPVILPVRAGRRRRDWEWFTFRVSKPLPPGDAGRNPHDPMEQDFGTCSILRYRGASASAPKECLVRIHSACATGDLFGSMKCDCGPQLHKAMDMIYEKGEGIVFYLADQEGRGIGLYAKAMAYLLQQNGLDTFEANSSLGYRDDLRSYGKVATLLQMLFELEKIGLLTNNPEKAKAMRDFGIKVRQVPLITPPNRCNSAYLAAKARGGHALPLPAPKPPRFHSLATRALAFK